MNFKDRLPASQQNQGAVLSVYRTTEQNSNFATLPLETEASVFFFYYSIVQTDESIVPILTLDNATQTEKELNR